MIDFPVVCNGHRHTLTIEPTGTLRLEDHDGEAEVAAEVLATLGAKFRCLDVKAAWNACRPFIGKSTQAQRNGDITVEQVGKLPPLLQNVLVNGYTEANKTPELLTAEDRSRYNRQSRRLTFVGAGSRKFWRIMLDGCCVIVRYGRIGTRGSKTDKVFETDEKARREFERLLTEKIKKGYRDE
jgi:predicted DNA-binding WGR domain protein